MQKLMRFFAVAVFLVFCLGISSIAEEITLTTYYPAPYGNYEELQASKLAVGSATTMPTTDGDLEASGTITAVTGFNHDGTDGDSETYTVITDLRITAGFVLQKRTRTITVSGGIVTDIDTESEWIDVGSVN